MQANTLSPTGIFGNNIRYVVPLFQRPYVWNREDQWGPLWDDVRNLAERLLAASSVAQIPPHFLGAIVVDEQRAPVGFIGVRHVVDGQQRLTTLQLLLDAARCVVQQRGATIDAQGLQVLVLNNPTITQHPDEVFKVWPTDRDQEAFRAAMSSGNLPVALAGSRIAQAHAFFVEKIADWATDSDGGQAVPDRLNALVRALRDHLKLVVIDLEPGDNAQVIFETLNHRGASLLAADLVKNLVFQIAQYQGADVAGLYNQYWQPLDSDYWRESIAQGRLFRPRIDIFLNYWLTMRLLREVPSDRIYAEFRDYIPGPAKIAEVVAELAHDARIYAQSESFPASTVEGTFSYRILKAMDSAAVGPFLLWVLRWDEADMPVEQRHRCLRALESWMVRRALVRATSKNVNQVIVELLKQMNDAGPSAAGDAVESWLAEQTADSRYWPDDEALHRALDEQPLYSAIPRSRLRMILESLEDSFVDGFGEGQACPRGLTVEHVMPQGWREHWGADIEGDVRAELARDRLVQSLGNLTLINGKFNASLSNRPWLGKSPASPSSQDQGKWAYLLAHSQLILNAKLVAEHESEWSEEAIRSRGAALVEQLAAIWTQPTNVKKPAHEMPHRALDPGVGSGEVAGEDQARATLSVGKYRALSRWLSHQDQDEIRLSFAQVEEILGVPLPLSARSYPPHWYGYEGTALGRAIRDAGFKASQVNLTDERVVFLRSRDVDDGPSVRRGDPELTPAELAPAGLKGKAALYARFWTRYLERLAVEHPDWKGGRTPDGANWRNQPSPIKGTAVGANFASGGRIRHELYIDSGVASRNSALFEDLSAQRLVLEDAYGRVLNFEPLPTARACRIADYAEGDVTDDRRYDEYIDWFFDAGQRLRRALKAIRMPSE